MSVEICETNNIEYLLITSCRPKDYLAFKGLRNLGGIFSIFFFFLDQILHFLYCIIFLVLHFLYFTVFGKTFYCIKYRNFNEFPGVKNSWNCTFSADFRTNCTKLCGNCFFPQNLHTRKLGEITIFFEVLLNFVIVISIQTLKHSMQLQLK